jgi:hypothetical protein
MTTKLLSFLLCTLVYFILMYSSSTFGQNANLQANSLSLTEALSACQRLSEKDSCQAHNSNNELVIGMCKTKAIANNDVKLLCVAEIPPAKDSTDGNTTKDNMADAHGHNHKHRQN